MGKCKQIRLENNPISLCFISEGGSWWRVSPELGKLKASGLYFIWWKIDCLSIKSKKKFFHGLQKKNYCSLGQNICRLLSCFWKKISCKTFHRKTCYLISWICLQYFIQDCSCYYRFSVFCWWKLALFLGSKTDRKGNISPHDSNHSSSDKFLLNMVASGWILITLTHHVYFLI